MEHLQSPNRFEESFKKNVVQRLLAGESLSALARELGIKESTLRSWRRVHQRTERHVATMFAAFEGEKARQEERETQRREEVRKNLDFAANVVAKGYPETVYFGREVSQDEKQRRVERFLHGDATTRVLRMISGWTEFTLPNLISATDDERTQGTRNFMELLRLMLNDLERTLPPAGTSATRVA